VVFIPIRAYDNYVFANMVLGMLQHAGINCHIKDEYTVTIDPLLSNAVGGMKLMVQEDSVADALKLITEAEQKYVQSVPCPICKSKSIELIIETTHYTSWYQKIKSRLINGQEQQVKKIYRCNNCQAEMFVLPGLS
jgi:hypothetical protein